MEKNHFFHENLFVLACFCTENEIFLVILSPKQRINGQERKKELIKDV